MFGPAQLCFFSIMITGFAREGHDICKYVRYSGKANWKEREQHWCEGGYKKFVSCPTSWLQAKAVVIVFTCFIQDKVCTVTPSCVTSMMRPQSNTAQEQQPSYQRHKHRQSPLLPNISLPVFFFLVRGAWQHTLHNLQSQPSAASLGDKKELKGFRPATDFT